MPKLKITQRAVDAAKTAGDKPLIIYDEVLTGFGLRVTPAGSKSYFAEYRLRGTGRTGNKKRVNVASHPKTSAEDARTKAKEVLIAADGGNDPIAEREKRKAVPTFADYVDTFMQDEVRPNRSANTATTYDFLLRHAVAELGPLKLDQIDKTKIKALHNKLGKAGKKVTANRVLATISGLYKYADATGAIGTVPAGFNPVSEARVTRHKEEGKERYLSTKELNALGAAILEGETAGIAWVVDEKKPKSKHLPKEKNRVTVLDPYSAGALRLLIFTGCRLREILHLKWTEVDIERGVLFLPTSKTGKKTVVLNAPALSVLSSLGEIKSGPYVIASPVSKDKPRADLKKPWALVSRRAGIEDVRLHDLRHTHASVAAGLGVPLQIIGKLLGHAQISTTERYAHLASDPVRAASDKTAATLAAALGMKQGQDSEDAGQGADSKVVSIRQGRKKK